MNIIDLLNSPSKPRLESSLLPSKPPIMPDTLIGIDTKQLHSLPSPLSLNCDYNLDYPPNSAISLPSINYGNYSREHDFGSLVISPVSEVSMPIPTLHNVLHPLHSQSLPIRIPFPTQPLTKSLPVKRFACPEPNCIKSFTRRYNLSAHMRTHRFEKPFECDTCKTKFARKHDLSRHIRSRHEYLKSYGPCGDCGASFSRSDAFTRHMKIEWEKRNVS